MKEYKETITITKISGTDVTYEGSEFFDGCDISNFPKEPKVGEKFVLLSDSVNPTRIILAENS